MPQTTTDYGRQKISWPDLGHDGGVNLHSKIVGSVERISNQITRYWSGVQTLQPSDVVQLEHNLDLFTAQLRVRLFEGGVELTSETGFLISEVSNDILEIENTGVLARTIEVYIEPRIKMRGGDLDPAIAISTTGNCTVNDLIVSGNLTVNGDTTQLNVATLEVEDKNLLLNKGGTDASASGAGLSVQGTSAVLAQISYDAATTSKFKAGANGTTKELVTVSDSQVLTNKDIDGGVASNTRRFTLPKASKAVLDGLTRKESTLVYADDEENIYIDTGSALKPVGGNWTDSGLVELADGNILAISLTTGLQLYVVEFEAGGVGTLSQTPFGTTAPADGAVVRLFGGLLANERQVAIVSADIPYGCLLNGDVTLGRGSMIELQWVSVLQRWVEVSRNMIGGI